MGSGKEASALPSLGMTSNDTRLAEATARWAEHMRRALQQSGLRRDRLAEMVGLSEAPISRLLNGRQAPTLQQVRDLAVALGVPVGEAAVLAVGADDGPHDTRQEVLRLRRQVESLRRDVEHLTLAQRSSTAAVVEAAAQASFGVTVWPAWEGPSEDVQFIAARRIRILVPEDELSMRGDGVHDGREAQDIVESRLRPDLPPEVVFAGRRDRDDFPVHPDHAARTAVLSVPVFTEATAPGDRPVQLSEHASAIVVVSLTPHAWAGSFGALLAKSLGWGYDTTRAVGAAHRPSMPSSAVPRLREREAQRTAGLLRELEQPRRHHVVSHIFRGLRNSAEIAIPQGPNPLIQRLTDELPVPFIVFLHESDDAIEFHLSQTRFIDRQPSEVRAELREQGARLKELLAPLQANHAALIHSQVSPWRVERVPDNGEPSSIPSSPPSEEQRRRLQWARTAEDALKVRRVLERWAARGRAPVEDPVARRILESAQPRRPSAG